MQEKRCKSCGIPYNTEGKGKKNFCSLKCRFMDKVEKTKECWNWKGSKISKRYGGFQIGEKNLLAHRVAYEIFKGTIPEGKIVCHQCDNGFCVNPSHLWIGNHQDNMRDMMQKQRRNSARGEKINTSRLNPKKIALMREMKLEGIMIKEIAEYFSVSRQTVRKALKGITWKHLYDI